MCCDQTKEGLNLVAHESEGARQAIAELCHEKPEFLIKEGKKPVELFLPREHSIPMEENRLERFEKIFTQIYDIFAEQF